MRYKIATASSAESLENAVCHLMQNGYKPLGSHVVATIPENVDYHSYVEYSQTMIKEDDNVK